MITNPSHHDDELQVETRSQRCRYLLQMYCSKGFNYIVAHPNFEMEKKKLVESLALKE